MSIAMIDGAFGDGMLTWLSSWPLPVLTVQQVADRSPASELARLCGNVPTSSIMSNDPDDVDVGLAGQLLVLERAVVLVVVKALDVGGDDLRRDWT